MDTALRCEVAREYSHSTGAEFVDRGLESLPTGLPVNGQGFEVKVDDQNPINGVQGCDRFVRIVRDVDPQAPSPKWMQDRLTAAGIARSLSLWMQRTTSCLILGHCTLMISISLWPRSLCAVRADETLVTLDEQERKLGGDDLLITDSAG